MDSDIKYYFLAGIVLLNWIIYKVVFTCYFAKIGRQLPTRFHRGWHHFYHGGHQGSRHWEKMLQVFLSHLLRPVLHYRCAVLTASLPFLLLPSVGNQCFLVQSQYIAPYFLCRGGAGTQICLWICIPPFPPSLLVPATDPDLWEKEALCSPCRSGISTAAKLCFQGCSICILFHPLWFLLWILLVSGDSSPKPVTSRALNDRKQAKWLARGMGSPGQPCFTCTVMELCKRNKNCSTTSVSVAEQSWRQVSPTITTGRKTTGLSYACKDPGCVTRPGFGPSWHSQPSSASLGLGKGRAGRWDVGRRREPADGGLAREVERGVWESRKGNKKNRKREEKKREKKTVKCSTWGRERYLHILHSLG